MCCAEGQRINVSCLSWRDHISFKALPTPAFLPYLFDRITIDRETLHG